MGLIGHLRHDGHCHTPMLDYHWPGGNARITFGVVVLNICKAYRECNMSKPVRWAAELAQVREVSLLGTADLEFWKEKLLQEDLLPSEREGRAQLMIVAADAKFMGFRFCELSFSVEVRQQQRDRSDGAYLLRAFNSNWFFAFCERVFFATPYNYGDVRVSVSLPASIHLVHQRKDAFQAELRADPSGLRREPSRCGEESWEGPIFLPKRLHEQQKQGSQGNWFLARIRGHTLTYPFIAGQDSITLRPGPDSEFLQDLLDSHFVPNEWAIREAATHAKSKTYKRAELLADLSRIQT